MSVFDWSRDRVSRRLTARMERLSCEAGWVMIGKEADCYGVRSGDHLCPVDVQIRYDDRFRNVVFQAWFPIRFSLEKPPSGLFGRLLLRSMELSWSSWQMSIGQSCEACLYLAGVIPTSVLNTELFRAICDEMATEIRSFRQELHDKFAYEMGSVVDDAPTRSRQATTMVRRMENVPGIRFLS